MDDPSKSIPHFVERWVCLHTGIDKTMKATMADDLRYLLFAATREAVELYRENVDRHGMGHHKALAEATFDVVSGLEVEAPLS